MIYGYIRVSTREQNEDRQVIAMNEFGVARENMIVDRQSGKNFERPEYRKLIRRIRPGDCIAVKSIDRLGRNYEEILDQWKHITKEKKADIVVLDMPLLDTRGGERDLTGRLIADIVLELLSYVAETERAFIRQRQAEGIAAAKAKGVKFGRKPISYPGNWPEVWADWAGGSIDSTAAVKRLGISRSTFYRMANEYLRKETSHDKR